MSRKTEENSKKTTSRSLDYTDYETITQIRNELKMKTGLLDSIPLDCGFFRRQRYDENGLPSSMQYSLRDTPREGMGQEPLSVGSDDDRIATFFSCGVQDFFWRMSYRNENFRYQFSAGRTDLIFRLLTKPLQMFLHRLHNLIMLLFFELLRHSPVNLCIRRNRFNRVQ